MADESPLDGLRSAARKRAWIVGGALLVVFFLPVAEWPQDPRSAGRVTYDYNYSWDAIEDVLEGKDYTGIWAPWLVLLYGCPALLGVLLLWACRSASHAARANRYLVATALGAFGVLGFMAGAGPGPGRPMMAGFAFFLYAFAFLLTNALARCAADEPADRRSRNLMRGVAGGLLAMSVIPLGKYSVVDFAVRFADRSDSQTLFWLVPPLVGVVGLTSTFVSAAAARKLSRSVFWMSGLAATLALIVVFAGAERYVKSTLAFTARVALLPYLFYWGLYHFLRVRRRSETAAPA